MDMVLERRCAASRHQRRRRHRSGSCGCRSAWLGGAGRPPCTSKRRQNPRSTGTARRRPNSSSCCSLQLCSVQRLRLPGPRAGSSEHCHSPGRSAPCLLSLAFELDLTMAPGSHEGHRRPTCAAETRTLALDFAVRRRVGRLTGPGPPSVEAIGPGSRWPPSSARAGGDELRLGCWSTSRARSTRCSMCAGRGGLQWTVRLAVQDRWWPVGSCDAPTAPTASSSRSRWISNDPFPPPSRTEVRSTVRPAGATPPGQDIDTRQSGGSRFERTPGL